MGWAIDLWPYVNGKALMSGVDLKEMEASNMVDVLHFLFEEDNHFTSEESAKSRSGVRVSIYNNLYGMHYKYAFKDGPKQGAPSASATDFGEMTEEDALSIFSPKAASGEAPKPYIPPTPFDPDKDNPYEGILDAPLN